MVCHNQRHRSKIGGDLTYLDLVLMAMSSVISSFIFKLLPLIHSATSSIQSFKLL